MSLGGEINEELVLALLQKYGYIGWNEGEELVGLVVPCITPHPQYPGLLATELIWAVKKEYRNKGVGSKLMTLYEDWAKGNGCSHIQVDNMGDERISKYYEKCGYTKVCESFIKEIK